MSLEEGVETRADGVEDDTHEDAQKSVCDNTLGGSLLAAGGHIALYYRLVGGVGDEVVGQSAQHDYPECG